MLEAKFPEPGRCKAEVLHRDTYRRTGRTPSGFELHYNRKQCKRKARSSGFCWQHEPGAWLSGLIPYEKEDLP